MTNGAFEKAEHGASGAFCTEAEGVNLRGTVVVVTLLSSSAVIRESLWAGKGRRKESPSRQHHQYPGQRLELRKHPDLLAVKE